MKFKYLVLFCLVFFVGKQSIFSQTNVPAGLVSGTWNLAGSPYLIQGGIMIANGTTLTIEPGVTVNFQGSYKLYIQGRLLAIGTPIDSIRFTTSNTTVGWLGLRFDNTPIINDTSKLNYCKIEYAKLTGAGSDAYGAGLYFLNFSKVIVSNCHIFSNSAPNGSGGGIYIENCSPKILNNLISNNICNSTGGGICLNESSSEITGNTISYNSSSSGAGIYCTNYCYSTISDNTVIYNVASSYGGGIYSVLHSEPMVIGNTISYNSASNGGGFVALDSNPSISNNTIRKNVASSSGGGVFWSNCNPIIWNNIVSYNSALNGGGIYGSTGAPPLSYNFISNNYASSKGGGIYLTGTAATFSNSVISNNNSPMGAGIYFNNDGYSATTFSKFTNCDIVNNRASYGGAMYCILDSDPEMINTIIWGNEATISGMQLFLNDETSDPKFSYCDVQGGTADFGLNGNFYTPTYQNNIDLDPMFVSPTAGTDTLYNGYNADWSLQNISPCINTGKPTGSYPSTDLSGNPRISNGIIDMGAYEVLSLGIENNINAISVEIYPNPSNGNYSFQMISKKNETINILLYDLNGKLLDQVNWNVIQGINTLQSKWNSLSNGVYFAKIIGETGETNVKLVVN